MNTWLVAKPDLNSTQLRAVELSAGEHRLISGPPGSGKSQILLHRTCHLANQLKLAPQRFRIFVSSNIIKGYWQSALSLLNLPESTITTLDSWSLSFYRTYLEMQLPTNIDGTLDFVRIRKAVFKRLQTIPSNPTIFDALLQEVLNRLRTNSISLPIYDFVMVDDGQDLDVTSIDILLKIAKHITIVANDELRIDASGLGVVGLQQKLAVKRSYSLTNAYRSSPFITSLAGQFVDDRNGRASFLQTSRNAQAEKETPVLYLASSLKDEKRRIVEVVRSRLAKGERVGLLLPYEKQVLDLAEQLQDPRFEIRRLVHDVKGDGSANRKDFSNDWPKLVTLANSRGLSFDTVIIPYLVPYAFSGLRADEICRLFFLGITRATRWVFLSTVKGSELPALERVVALEQHGLVNIQVADDQSKNVAKPTTPPPAPSHDSSEDLIDLL